MDKRTAEHAAQILKTIAHPARLQIVRLLQAKEMCVNDIAEALDSKQAIASQQLNMMKNKGVLSCRHNGVKVYYHIEDKNVTKLLNCMFGHCKPKRG